MASDKRNPVVAAGESPLRGGQECKTTIPSPRKLPINIEEPPDKSSGVSRRDFLKISALAAAVPAVASPKTVMAAGQ
jgi:hypothetical protein